MEGEIQSSPVVMQALGAAIVISMFILNSAESRTQETTSRTQNRHELKLTVNTSLPALYTQDVIRENGNIGKQWKQWKLTNATDKKH